ncbi:MAG: host attachment protein [Variibacter sp.]|nr:host attachment protein [Variibacter sp.]
MTELKIGKGDWVVVCDGRKALILQNTGDRQALRLQAVETLEQTNPPTHAQGTDRPGSVYASTGTSRSSVEQTDWHDEAERQFLVDLARKLDQALAAGATRALSVVAPPRALGMLREAYTPAIKSALRGEIDKDLVKHPVHEIERHLSP